MDWKTRRAIDERIDHFASELMALVRKLAFEAVHESLGGTPPRPQPRRPARRAQPGGDRGGARLTRHEIRKRAAAIEDGIVHQLRSTPMPVGITALANELNQEKDLVRGALQRLMARGAIKPVGEARGRKYVIANADR